MGGAGGVVEADETYFGKTEVRPTVTKEGKPYKSRRRKFGPAGKRAVIALVERGGSVRTFHVEKANKMAVASIMSEDIERETVLYTDESAPYPEVGKSSPITPRCATAPMNMFAATFIPTRLKAISRFSSAA